MRARLQLIFLLALLAGPAIFAQAPDGSELKFAARISVAGYPVAPGTDYSLFGHGYLDVYPSGRLSSLYKDTHGPVTTTGCIAASADMFFGNRSALSLDLAVTPVWTALYDGTTGQPKGTKTTASICLMPQYRLYYFKREFVNMYGSIGLGIMAITGDDAEISLALQTVPLGIEVGRRLFGFADLGLGIMYLGARVGIGYRF